MISKVCLLVALWCVAGTVCDLPMTYDQGLAFCCAQHNVSQIRPNELDHFMEHGEFPTGNAGVECIFDCLAEAIDIVDLDSSISETKLRAMSERSPPHKFAQFLASEAVLQTCLPREKVSSPCNTTYSFVKCAVDSQIGLANAAVKPVASAFKFDFSRYAAYGAGKGLASSAAQAYPLDIFVYLGLLFIGYSSQ